jgi:recombination protein RecA
MPKRTDDIDKLLDRLNKRLGGEAGRAIIQRGSEIQWATAARFPTGSLGLDIALNGGLPRGMVTQYMGEESSGKTTLALKAAAMIQALYEEEASIGFVAVEGFNKHWANMCGLAIPFSRAELASMNEKDRKRYKDVEEVGDVTVASAISGEDSLEIAHEMIKSGAFHLVVVDSIAALSVEAELEKEMIEQTMGQLPRLVGKFLRKCYSAFNTELEDGSRNETAVLLINQVREKIGGYGHPAPEPPGGRGLRHAAAAIVRFQKSDLLRADVADEKRAYGRKIKIRVEKSKIGPPYREAEFEFYFDDQNGFGPGDIDSYQELRIWGIRAGLIHQTGNTMFELDGKKLRGKAAVEAYLSDHMDRAAQLRREILRVLTSADVE